jgi:hypothetical protein
MKKYLLILINLICMAQSYGAEPHQQGMGKLLKNFSNDCLVNGEYPSSKWCDCAEKSSRLLLAGERDPLFKQVSPPLFKKYKIVDHRKLISYFLEITQQKSCQMNHPTLIRYNNFVESLVKLLNQGLNTPLPSLPSAPSLQKDHHDDVYLLFGKFCTNTQNNTFKDSPSSDCLRIVKVMGTSDPKKAHDLYQDYITKKKYSFQDLLINTGGMMGTYHQSEEKLKSLEQSLSQTGQKPINHEEKTKKTKNMRTLLFQNISKDNLLKGFLEQFKADCQKLKNSCNCLFSIDHLRKRLSEKTDRILLISKKSSKTPILELKNYTEGVSTDGSPKKCGFSQEYIKKLDHFKRVFFENMPTSSFQRVLNKGKSTLNTIIFSRNIQP